MKCPVCNEPDLLMSERQGIEIDYCPRCRGVWLDRGELDKLIDRSAGSPPPQEPPRHQDERRYPDEGRYRDDKRHYRKKRGGFLGEIFDFD
jgi:Zn-finger nucleic acid-binding protein